MVVFNSDLSAYMLISAETCSNSGVIGSCLFAVLLGNFARKVKGKNPATAWLGFYLSVPFHQCSSLFHPLSDTVSF